MGAHTGSLESRLFRDHWNDGLLDLLAGIGATGIGILWLSDLVAVGAAVPAILAALWIPLRRAVVEPRAGYVEFSEERLGKLRRHHWRTLLLGTVVLLVMLALSSWAVSWSRAGEVAPLRLMAPALPAIELAALAALTAWGLGLSRFLGYAGVLVVSGLVVALFDGPPGAAMVVGGVVILLAGVRLLGRFLRTTADARARERVG